HHFQGTAGGSGYELAVVPTAGSGSIYHSVDGFNPKADAKADASADLFHLRLQDFGALVSEIRRFALFTGRTGYASATAKTVIRHTITAPPDDAIRYENHSGPVSIFVQKGRSGVSTTVADRIFTTRADAPAGPSLALTTAPHWRLLVKHPSGSLEQAVGSVRRRNLLVSTGILGILGVSVAFLLVSPRPAPPP